MSEQISDQKLADSISESDGLNSNEMPVEDLGFVEAGIPPALDGEVSPIDTDEESFGIDDFSETFSTDSTSVDSGVGEVPTTDENSTEATESTAKEDRCEEDFALGDVANFRKTLKDLSQQLEIDRLAFLYGKMKEDGCDVPDLESISADIKGEKKLHPIGDKDTYSKTPFARLQGWIAGFSFGISRRAKKFDQF